jgi:hypothetical protein
MPLTFTAQTFSTAREFIDACAAPLLETRPTHANLALATSYDIAKEEASSTSSDTKHWWLAVSPTSHDSTPKLLFTLAVLKTYPGVLACSVDPKSLSSEVIDGAMQALVSAANAASLPPTRLSSINGPKALGDPFADNWAASHNLTRMQKPIMHIYHSFVSTGTLRPAVRPKVANVTLGKVTIEELDVAGDMLVKFTLGKPHEWDFAAARRVAEGIINSGGMFGVWVDGNLKGYVAVTRPTPGVKAISQVFTYEDARGKGLAELVVREACERYICISPLRSVTVG